MFLGHISEVSSFDESELHLTNHALHVLECIDLHLACALVVLKDLFDRVDLPKVLVDQQDALNVGLVQLREATVAHRHKVFSYRQRFIFIIIYNIG